jgi:hypothetical protein
MKHFQNETKSKKLNSILNYDRGTKQIVKSGNTKGGSVTLLLTSGLTGLDSAV